MDPFGSYAQEVQDELDEAFNQGVLQGAHPASPSSPAWGALPPPPFATGPPSPVAEQPHTEQANTKQPHTEQSNTEQSHTEQPNTAPDSAAEAAVDGDSAAQAQSPTGSPPPPWAKAADRSETDAPADHENGAEADNGAASPPAVDAETNGNVTQSASKVSSCLFLPLRSWRLTFSTSRIRHPAVIVLSDLK